MGKRSNFERNPRNYYRTFDPKAVKVLAPLLAGPTAYIEPCAGDGVLIRQLNALGHRCAWASDLEPQAPGIAEFDVFDLKFKAGALVITNPPWSRDFLHPFILWLMSQGVRAWLLWDTNWVNNVGSADILRRFVVSVHPIGRMKWVENTKDVSKDDCAWFYLDPNKEPGPALFYPRS